MKGFDLVWSSFKTLSIVKHRVVINTGPFDLILQLPRPLTALKHLLNIPLRLLVIDYRQRGFLILPWQWVP
jgi:hypothetical protein